MSSPILLPAGTVIGNPGWNNYYYRLLQYESYSVTNGTTTLKGINMAYVDEANHSVTYPIAPGEYILAFGASSGYATTPITVIDGKTQINPVLTSIETTALPYKTIYKEGDKLDLSGMTVQALYDITLGGRAITDYTTEPADGSELTVLDSSVTISYTENGVQRQPLFPSLLRVQTIGRYTNSTTTNTTGVLLFIPAPEIIS